jgi:hypothetical protein
MNDDELAYALREAMGERTAGDTPSRELMQALATTRVRGPRPYLVPFSVAAVVTALTTGGVLLAQAGPALDAGSDSTPAPLSFAPSVAASAVPPPGAVTSASPPAPSPAPTPAATSSTKVAPGQTAIPQASERVEPRSPGADDRALLAAAKSFSVVTWTVADAAHPADKTAGREVFPHDGTISFFAGAVGLDWDGLAALPSDQATFDVQVKATGSPPNPVEKGVQELNLAGPLPLQLRKNALAMLESAPAATTTEHSFDHLGRAATKVSILTDNIVDDYYFDPVSYRLLESGETFTAAWKADYTAHAAAGSEPVGSYTDTYTDFLDYAIIPKSS